MTIKIPIFKSCLLAASLAQLTPSLSADTKLDFDILIMPKGANIEYDAIFEDNSKDIIVKFGKSKNELVFPQNGVQPTTQEAGLFSGARNLDDDEITYWYVDTFLDNIMAYDSSFTDDQKNIFEDTLEKIASDPVGRVLLYRLIIETTRVDEKGEHCCMSIISGLNTEEVEDRNYCCKIKILNNINKGLTFGPGGYIKFDVKDTSGTNVLTKDNKYEFRSKDEQFCPLDVGLFHEMLHWLHFLVNPKRFDNTNKTEADLFKYPLRCYYGDITDLTVWDADLDAEEIATILGSPNHNKQTHIDLIPNEAFYLTECVTGIETKKGFIPKQEVFLNGDDLSENAYRLAQSQKGKNKFYLRFGHNSEKIDYSDLKIAPKRFLLAHKVASECYKEITGHEPKNWAFKANQAIAPEPTK